MQLHFIWNDTTNYLIISSLLFPLLYQFFVVPDSRTKVDRESGAAPIGVGQPNKPMEKRRATNSF